MTPYLELTDDEWEAIRPILPIAKRGPRRPRDRSTCAALLFARAADVSLESLPLGRFPDAVFLRSTTKRWRRDGVLPRLFEVGAKAEKRMEKQYDDEIIRLTLARAVVTGEATATMPRWTHVRGV
jgi:transposase